jgi:hypothetical protein
MLITSPAGNRVWLVAPDQGYRLGGAQGIESQMFLTHFETNLIDDWAALPRATRDRYLQLANDVNYATRLARISLRGNRLTAQVVYRLPGARQYINAFESHVLAVDYLAGEFKKRVAL